MPRPPRPIAGRLVYQVINRAPVFCEDCDYAAYLKALGDLKRMRPFEVCGHCLMSNHVHLRIRSRNSKGTEEICVI